MINKIFDINIQIQPDILLSPFWNAKCQELAKKLWSPSILKLNDIDHYKEYQYENIHKSASTMKIMKLPGVQLENDTRLDIETQCATYQNNIVQNVRQKIKPPKN